MSSNIYPMITSAVFLACTLLGALAGSKLRDVLRDSLTQESMEMIKRPIGLIASLSALVISFALASAKTSFDSIDGEIKGTAAQVLSLDRDLAGYGKDAAGLRLELKRLVAQTITASWKGKTGPLPDPFEKRFESEILAEKIRTLGPKSESQRMLQSHAVQVTESILSSRWMIVRHLDPPFHALFFGVLLFWLTIIFVSFGLLGNKNIAVVVALVLCSLSVSAAIFLIMELGSPFDGLIRISPEPLLYALARLNQ